MDNVRTWILPRNYRVGRDKVTQAIIADQLTYANEKVKVVDYISLQVAEGEIF
jgi:hypothetical protein